MHHVSFWSNTADLASTAPLWFKRTRRKHFRKECIHFSGYFRWDQFSIAVCPCHQAAVKVYGFFFALSACCTELMRQHPRYPQQHFLGSIFTTSEGFVPWQLGTKPSFKLMTARTLIQPMFSGWRRVAAEVNSDRQNVLTHLVESTAYYRWAVHMNCM